MHELIKTATTTYIPGDPGSPGTPATLAQAGYWTTESSTSCGYTTVTAGSLTSPDALALSQVQYTCITTEAFVYRPAVAASPGIPPAPPTPEQIIVSLNEGWNTYARAIAALVPSSYLNYTVKSGTKGALLAVAYSGYEAAPIGSFTHGVMTDVSGIRVFESGVVVATLAPNIPGREIRIARLPDGRILYAVDSGAFYISSAPAYPLTAELFVYGMLYAGYDEVSFAEFVAEDILAEPATALKGTGSLLAYASQFVEATLSGSGSMITSATPGALMAGVGTMTALINAAVLSGSGTLTGLAKIEQGIETALTGSGALLATAATGGRGSASLPLFSSYGGDTAYGIGQGVLPYFTSGLTNGGSAYIPPQITRGYANLPSLVGYAHGFDIDKGNGSASLPIHVGAAGDYAYGIGYGALPRHIGAAYGGFNPVDTMVLISSLLGRMTMGQQIDITLVLTSTGQVASVQTMTRAQALEMLSSMQAASTLSMLGVYGYTLLSGVNGLSIQALSINSRPDLYENGVVWVVNTTNNASSQYEQYGFNSFFTRSGKAYGVANDGIYLLEGSTDNGAAIEALAEMGRNNYGSPQLKSLTNVYLGVGSDNTMYLKVNADSQEYVYEMRNSSTDIDNKRVDVGRGLKGNYWNMTLLNKEGAAFKLASVVFEPVPLTRKI